MEYTNIPPPEPEISLRDVILSAKSVSRYLLKRWYWLLLAGLIGAFLLALQAYYSPLTYRSSITFVVSEENNSGSGGVGAILGQFGLGGGGGDFNFEKILAMSESQRLINNMLLDTMEIDGQADLLGNQIIKEYSLVEEWELDPANGAIRLSSDTIPELSISERRILKSLYGLLLYNELPLLKSSRDELTNILSLTAQTTNEELSLKLSEALYRRLSDFYTAEITGASQRTVARLSFKADSLYRELNAAEYQLATLADTRLGVTQFRDNVRQSQLNRKVNILGIAYGEVLRNLETASFAMSTKDPFFQTIDEPFFPLDRVRDNYLVQGMIGFIVGSILASMLIVIGWVYQRALYDQSDVDPE